MKKLPRKTQREYAPYKKLSPFQLARLSNSRLTKTAFRAAVRKVREEHSLISTADAERKAFRLNLL